MVHHISQIMPSKYHKSLFYTITTPIITSPHITVPRQYCPPFNISPRSSAPWSWWCWRPGSHQWPCWQWWRRSQPHSASRDSYKHRHEDEAPRVVTCSHVSPPEVLLRLPLRFKHPAKLLAALRTRAHAPRVARVPRVLAAPLAHTHAAPVTPGRVWHVSCHVSCSYAPNLFVLWKL